MAEAYRPVRGELGEVEDLLRKPDALEGLAAFLGLSADSRAVQEAERYIIEAGGKRLRAALALLSVKLCGAPARKGVPLAAGIELVHTASLVIDDLIVDADLRRSKPTVHRRWDDPEAMSAALCLQLRAAPAFLESFRGAAEPMAFMGIVGQTLTRALWGAILQHRKKTEIRLSEEEYMEIVEQKTAALFELCCEGGAIFAGADAKSRNALRDYGRNLGVAFQIIDDALDLESDVKTLGKRPGSDIVEGRMTLPLIHFMRSADRKGAKRMASLLPPRGRGQKNRPEILELLKEQNSMNYCRKLARATAAASRKALRPFETSDEIESLKTITKLAVERKK